MRYNPHLQNKAINCMRQTSPPTLKRRRALAGLYRRAKFGWNRCGRFGL